MKNPEESDITKIVRSNQEDLKNYPCNILTAILEKEAFNKWYLKI